MRILTILLGTFALACAGVPNPGRFILPEPDVTLSSSGCPYSTVYVAMSSNGDKRDQKLADRVRLTYADALIDGGFQIVEHPEDAYWSAFSLVNASGRLDSKFAWSVYMMATHDVAGTLQTPLRFAVEGDDPERLSGFMFLREIRIMELDDQVRTAGEDTAEALVGHALRMCVAWSEDESLREALAQEIRKVREHRIGKSLQLGVDEPSLQ